jgi:signal transduction histidine kinase
MRDFVADATVVLLGLALGFATAAEPGSLMRPYGGAAAVVLALTALPLAFRRRAPLAVAWFTGTLTVALLAVELAAPGTLLRTEGEVDLTPQAWWPPTAPFAAYGATAFVRDHRRAVAPVLLLLVPVCFMGAVLPSDVVLRQPAGQETDTFEALVFRSAVVIVGGALLGLYISARRHVVRGLTERAERAERERHLLAEQARADERARLAAEMHDVVAHRVTLMVLQAGALRVRAPDEGTRLAAEELRGTGCQALEELRDVIGLLRRSADGDDDAPPSGPLPDLSALISESASVGVPVQLDEAGDPPLASPVVGRTAYRIVQEALTNVRKHAPGARVRVEIRYRPDGVRLAVRNSAPSGEADAELAGSGSGAGLAGLRERVELIGGTFGFGSSPEGGFEVEASLPAYVPVRRVMPVATPVASAAPATPGTSTTGHPSSAAAAGEPAS